MNGRARRAAVVLSGGGAKGAYEVGVMRALFAGESPSTGGVPVAPEVYTGTSVGAYNAIFIAAQGETPSAEANARLEQVWREQIADTAASCGNGVYRLRADALQYLSLGCLRTPFQDLAELTADAVFWTRYAATRAVHFLQSEESLERRLLQSIDFTALFSWEPFVRLVAATIDLAALDASSKELTVLATNWRDGTIKFFDRHDVARVYGDQAVLACAAIPGIFPPVTIDDVPYVDGATLMNTPLSPAIRLGAEELHVVYVDPLVRDVPFPTLPDTLSTVYRLYVILVASNFRGDITNVGQINREIGLLRRTGVEVAARRLGPGAANAPLHRVLARRRQGRPYRELTVHSYRPRLDLGGVMGLLDFSAANIDAMIEQGYRDALAHDCDRELCILPAAETIQTGRQEATG